MAKPRRWRHEGAHEAQCTGRSGRADVLSGENTLAGVAGASGLFGRDAPGPWSGLPVVHVRATVFLQNRFFLAWAAASMARDGLIRLPFGTGHTSPVDVR